MEMAVVGASGLEDFDEQIIKAWRDDLLDRAWTSLEDFERRTGQPYHTVLKYRVSHPKDTSAKMAERLSPVLGRSVSAGAFRQLLQRARDKWAGSLIDEVKVSLRTPTRDSIEEELADLRLLELCKPVLDRLGLDKADH
jgi:hypothetical protein